MNKYILGIDQSTQGTKAVLFDISGAFVARSDKKHKQHVNDKKWISHNLEEIYQSMIEAVKDVLFVARVNPSNVVCAGICNQRETSAIWEKEGNPLNEAIVWQCQRAVDITNTIYESGVSDDIYKRSGLKISPYFSAAKFAWLIKNTTGVKQLLESKKLRLGTVDTFLLYRLSKGTCYATDFSNASRTQLMNINTLEWDDQLREYFCLTDVELPSIKNSDAYYCSSDFEGIFPSLIPIHAVMGDSHAAFFGQNCTSKGSCKVTFGTGSSIMLNIGNKINESSNNLSRSIGWKSEKGLNYVLEGNINYTGSIITWLLDDVGIISNVEEANQLPWEANIEDSTIMIPAFSGLGAPYWNSNVQAAFLSMTRQTGRAELVKASVDAIVFQIQEILDIMRTDTGLPILDLKVDGGPTSNKYLLSTLGNLSSADIYRPNISELSAMGVAYMAGLSYGIYSEKVFNNIVYEKIIANSLNDMTLQNYTKWKNAVNGLLSIDIS